MVDALVDTAITIDMLRDYQPAKNWFQDANQELGLTKFVWLETIQGAKSKAKQREALRVINSFIIVPTTEEDLDWAIEKLALYLPFHNGLDYSNRF